MPVLPATLVRKAAQPALLWRCRTTLNGADDAGIAVPVIDADRNATTEAGTLTVFAYDPGGAVTVIVTTPVAVAP